ncbi:MAG: hypothetical protein AB7V43_00610 [Acidimicrobiia bacterium]
MELWERYQSEVSCPTCGAPIGERCDLPDELVHPARADAWAELHPADVSVPKSARTTRSAVKSVRCPRCGARPESNCWGAEGPRSSAHLDRHAAALAAGAPRLRSR